MKLRKALILFGLLTLAIVTQEVKAENYKGEIYVLHYPESGFSFFAQEQTKNLIYNSSIIKTDIENKIFYSVDQIKKLERVPANTYQYITTEEEIIKELTEEKYNRISMIAYYGYKYKDSKTNHEAKKWYGITQIMIWKELNKEKKWLFKEKEDEILSENLYKNEIEEINDLIKNHNKKSSFADLTIKLLPGEEITLTDENQVFEDYFRVNSIKYTSIIKDKNKLIIKALNTGKDVINYSKTTTESKKFAFYKSNQYQNIINRGMLHLPYFQIKVEVTGGILNIKKTSLENAEINKEITLKDSVYEIYDEKNNKIKEVTTDENGNVKVSLEYGKYKIKEKIASKGYKLNEKIYEIEISKDNNNINLEIESEIIKGTLKITKTKGGSGENFTQENGTFSILDKEDNIIKNIKTNKEGFAKINLPYGTYKIKQIDNEKGYIYEGDKEITITEEKEYGINLKNIKLSKLIIKKVTNSFLEVYDAENNLIFSGKTNENKVLEVENLKIGKYYIKEKTAPKYYHINKEKIKFEVKENGQLLELCIDSKRKKGNVIIKVLNQKKQESTLIKIYNLQTNKKEYQLNTKNNLIKINNFPAGKYYIIEESNKIKSKRIYFELKNENELVKINIKEEKTITIPNAGKNEMNLKIVSIILMAMGVLYLKYDRKKNC